MFWIISVCYVHNKHEYTHRYCCICKLINSSFALIAEYGKTIQSQNAALFIPTGGLQLFYTCSYCWKNLSSFLSAIHPSLELQFFMMSWLIKLSSLQGADTQLMNRHCSVSAHTSAIRLCLQTQAVVPVQGAGLKSPCWASLFKIIRLL